MIDLGDLVRCVWQPGTSRVRAGCAEPMEYHIKDELGIVVDFDGGSRYKIMFPQLAGYDHWLCPSAFEVV